MKPTHDEIVQWMKDYFATYNLYAQDAATVHRMDEYFAPDLQVHALHVGVRRAGGEP